jgi:hypothetical protein
MLFLLLLSSHASVPAADIIDVNIAVVVAVAAIVVSVAAAAFVVNFIIAIVFYADVTSSCCRCRCNHILLLSLLSDLVAVAIVASCCCRHCHILLLSLLTNAVISCHCY